MAWPLTEAGQLFPGSFPHQLSEKPYNGLCQKKKKASGSTEAENSVWEWGEARLGPLLGYQYWCQAMQI